MPSDDVHRFIDLEIQNFQECGLSAMDIARIMSEFNVSFDMALNRLESLGVINTDQKMRLDNIKTEMKVGNLLRAVGGNSKLNEPSEVFDIPHEYIDYVIYNYNHNAIPKETLERVLAYYKLVIDDVSDKIVEFSDDDDDLDDLIGVIDDCLRNSRKIIIIFNSSIEYNKWGMPFIRSASASLETHVKTFHRMRQCTYRNVIHSTF